MISVRPLFAELGRVYRRLDQADHVVIALDYDGTLAPIAARPIDAAIAPEGIATLEELASLPGYSLAFVSGRSLADLQQRLRVDAIFVGNHGLEIRGGGVEFVHPRALETREAVNNACWDLEAALHGIPGILVERKELTASVHYRQAPVDLVPWVYATVGAVLHPYQDRLVLAQARKTIEIRPRLHWNKGSAVRVILDEIAGSHPALVCAGDDTADEDMFAIRRWEVSIKVGSPKYTRAAYYVRGVPQLLAFLELLVKRAHYPSAPHRPDDSASAPLAGSVR